MSQLLGQDIFDIIIVLILVAFTIRGWINGFIGEVASVASIVGGFWAAHTFHTLLSPHLTFITAPVWRTTAAYAILFAGAVIAVAIVARLLKKILTFAFADFAESVCGAALGLVKGLLICAIIFFVIGKFFGDATFYKKSHTRPYIEYVTSMVRTALPPDIVKRFNI